MKGVFTEILGRKILKKNPGCTTCLYDVDIRDSFIETSPFSEPINSTISHSRSTDGEAGPYFSGTYGMPP